MGVAGYSEMARMLGMSDVAEKYAAIAKKMAVKWEEMANEGDHYRLAFDRKNTWSQKYNMVWDKLWNLCHQIRKPSRNSLILSINISMKQYHVYLSVTGTIQTAVNG